jgi:cytochrome c-type biogenesis protein CcmH/NrfG
MTTLFILSFLGYFWNGAEADASKFEAAVLQTIDQLHQASSVEEVKSGVSKLERLAVAEPNRWEAHYYLAYARIMHSFREADGETIDAILDQAEQDITKSLELGGDASELNALQAYLYQGRIQVSSFRGMKFSGLAAEALEKAIGLKPSNARAHFLMGMNVYHTPSMFGGGARNALPHFEKAVECYNTATSSSNIYPHWGREMAQQMTDKCKK